METKIEITGNMPVTALVFFFFNLVFCKSVPSALHAEVFGKVVLRGRMHKQGGSYILAFHYKPN